MKNNHKYSVIALSIMATIFNTNATVMQLPTVDVIAESDTKKSATTAEVSHEQIQKNHSIDLKTAIKDVAGVEVISIQGARQGNDSVNIRGLSGNRVGMSIDGIALPEANEHKPLANRKGLVFGRGAYVEPTSLKSISIHKSSSANNVAGHVDMKTLSPDDLLNNKKFGGHVETNFNSLDNSFMLSGAAAMSIDAWRGMLLTTFRKGHETKNMGKNNVDGEKRTTANPIDHHMPYLLTKHEYDIDENHMISLTGEYQYKKQKSIQKSSLISDGIVTKAEANDVNQRARVSIGHIYHNEDSFINKATTHIYWQNTQTDAKRSQEGSRFNSNQRITYTPNGYSKIDFKNSANVFGLNTDASSKHKLELASNQIDINNYYHFDINYHNLKSKYNTNYKMNSNPNAPAPKNIVDVSKVVADSTLIPINFTFDSDIELNDFIFNTGLGLHYYSHNPSDDGYKVNTTHEIGKIKKTSGFNITPKIGVAWQIHELLMPYAKYTRGFKASSPQQLTSVHFRGETKPAFFGNSNLKAETVNNFELGIKGRNDDVQYNVNAFYNLYNNFIEMAVLKEKISIAGGEESVHIQFQNMRKATIYGVEANTKWSFYDNFNLNGVLSYAKGEVEENNKNVPLNSISPFKIKVGFEYDNDIWGANLNVSHTLAKKNKDINFTVTGDGASDIVNTSKKYTLVDIGAYFKPIKDLTINANINNLFNQKYWKWSDISYLVPSTRDQSDDSVGFNKDNVDRYTSAGINFSIGIKYTF